MKKNILRALILSLSLVLGLGFFVGNTYAEGEEQDTSENTGGTSIRLSPANIVLQFAANTVYENSFEVKNEGGSDIKVEVYAAPYSYAYSAEEDEYKLGFNNENNYTQISRWIDFEDDNGNYVEKTTRTVKAGEAIKVNFRIAVPKSVPDGGQYAVIFAHALSTVTTSNGIKTEASPGIVVYGRSADGESVISAEITKSEIRRGITENSTTRNNIYAFSKIKNSGNTDFTAVGKLTVEPIIGFSSYETEINTARVSVIPDVELAVSDEWEETPSFGIYKATWTVAAGEETQTIDKVFFLIPPAMIIIAIIVLTFLIIWIIMLVRKRKERRSRLAV